MIDDLMWVFWTRGNENDVPAADRDRLSGNAQRSFSLEYNKHLLLRMVK